MHTSQIAIRTSPAIELEAARRRVVGEEVYQNSLLKLMSTQERRIEELIHELRKANSELQARDSRSNPWTSLPSG